MSMRRWKIHSVMKTTAEVIEAEHLEVSDGYLTFLGGGTVVRNIHRSMLHKDPEELKEH